MAGKFLSSRNGWLLLSALLLGGCFFHSRPKPSGGGVGAMPALPPGQRYAEGYQHRVSGSPAGYKAVSFAALPQWPQQDFAASLNAFRKSCTALKNKPQWQNVCAQADRVGSQPAAAKQFFEQYFTPWEVSHNGQLGGIEESGRGVVCNGTV